MKRLHLTAAVALLISGFAAAASATGPAIAPPKTKRESRTVQHGGGGWGGYQRGPGWSFAHVKRMARKRRNVLRNRRAHRGAR